MYLASYALTGALIGAIWGAFLARKRGGKVLDMAQYAGALAILGGLVVTLASIFIMRLSGG